MAELKTVLARDGLRPALGFLNSLTGHRFTSLYLFDAGTLRSHAFFDRETPDPEPPDDIPVEVSYCVYVRDSRRAFQTEDSLRDDRVIGHPKRRDILAYCGVPLTAADGRVFGTLCRFDFVPTPISEANVQLMEAFAPLLKETVRGARI